jgi:hypothetical protein
MNPTLALPPPADLRRIALALGIAVGGGALAFQARVPLAWMIGAMTAISAASFAGFRAPPLVLGRTFGLIVLGTALGQSFTPSVLAALAGAAPAVVLGGVAAILLGALVGRLTRRLAGTDAATAFFCNVPGGIVVMVVLAARAGADVAAVTLSQTLRMAVVVLTYPPVLGLFGARLGMAGVDAVFAFDRPPVWLPGLALLLAATTGGALLLRLANFANPWLLGPLGVALGLTVSGQVWSGVPGPMVDAAQVLMGASLGARLSRDFLLRARRLVLASVVSVALLSAALVLTAMALGSGFGLPLASCVLGMAPGGMPEMAITAKVLNLGVPLVLAFHLVRTLLCNLLVAPLWRLFERL